jgi:hypothetical protein
MDKGFVYSKIQSNELLDFDPAYKNFCNLDLGSNFELNAVQCSFYGDYQNALDQATKRESVSLDPNQSISFDSDLKSEVINSLNTLIQSNEADESSKLEAQKMLNSLNTPDAKELIAHSKPMSALEYIKEEAKNHHFTLINEAHWNSQHRSFTKSLLKLLWEQGYRYLALEALSHHDSTLHERGYPVQSTGYYTKDTDFGNLIREAIAIGYKPIAYETQNGNNGTLRDTDQAQNIYDKTFKYDKTGKVLIHAGYSHISEIGDSNYEPMGFQLKKLIGQDLLSIDQESMIGYNDIAKQHHYYREAVERFNIEKPTVLLNNEDKVIIDPIISIGIDIQVFHPATKIIKGRPDWKYQSNIKSVPLSIELQKYKDHLIQVIKEDEAMDAVPIDQFVISEGKVLLLPSGKYKIRIINCSGNMVAISELIVH